MAPRPNPQEITISQPDLEIDSYSDKQCQYALGLDFFFKITRISLLSSFCCYPCVRSCNCLIFNLMVILRLFGWFRKVGDHGIARGCSCLLFAGVKLSGFRVWPQSIVKAWGQKIKLKKIGSFPLVLRECYCYGRKIWSSYLDQLRGSIFDPGLSHGIPYMNDHFGIWCSPMTVT